MQILNTLQERHIYNVLHPRWSTSTQKLSVLYCYTIQKNEGMQPATTPFHFFFTLSPYLSHNHRDSFTMLQYNTQSYQNVFHLQGSYHGKILRVTQYHRSTNYWPTNIPKIYFRDQPLHPLQWDKCTVKLGYKYGRSGSTTNNVTNKTKGCVIESFYTWLIAYAFTSHLSSSLGFLSHVTSHNLLEFLFSRLSKNTTLCTSFLESDNSKNAEL